MAIMRASKLSVVSRQPVARASGPLHPNVVADQRGASAEATKRSANPPSTSPAPPARPVTRHRVVGVRVTPAEYAAIEAAARDAGLSIGSYLRKQAIGTAGARARRKPTIDAELKSYAIAQLNRVGGNLNQIAKRFNSALPVGNAEVDAAAREVREAVRLICRSMGFE